MARPLPVGPRDILYQVELATGRGVIRDAVEIANDTSASLARKMQLYKASAVMAPQDRYRLEQMIETMKQDETPILALAAPAPQLAADQEPVTSHTSPVLPPPEPPDAPQGPQGISNTRSPLPPGRDGLGTDPVLATTTTSHVRVLSPREPFTRTLTSNTRGVRPVRPVRPDAGKTREQQAELRQKRVEVARKILAQNPTVGVRDLTRQIAMATRHRISESTASDIRRELLAEIETEAEQQDEQDAAQG